MKRGRPKFERAPRLNGPIPEEHQFLFECKMALKHIRDGGDAPADPEFIRDLLERYIESANRPLTSPEIAAMVDWKAARCPSISQAIQWVSHLVGGTDEAVGKIHRRHGKTNKELISDRTNFLRDLEVEGEMLGALTEEDLAWARNELRLEAEINMRTRIAKAEKMIQQAKDDYNFYLEATSRGTSSD